MTIHPATGFDPKQQKIGPSIRVNDQYRICFVWRGDVPRNRVTKILRGERAITAETALRLARFFGNSAEFWLNLQSRYDLEIASDRQHA